jgi:hypothetical protein
MNYLKAVFWDYPQLAREEAIKTALKEQPGSKKYRWIMSRFLEHGRVVDTFSYFRLREIIEHLPKLKLSPYTLKKWRRLIEVYGNGLGK